MMVSMARRRIDFTTALIAVGLVWMTLGTVVLVWSLIVGNDIGYAAGSVVAGAFVAAVGYVLGRRSRSG